MRVSQLLGEEIEMDEQTRELNDNWSRLNREEKDCVLRVISIIIKHR